MIIFGYTWIKYIIKIYFTSLFTFFYVATRQCKAMDMVHIVFLVDTIAQNQSFSCSSILAFRAREALVLGLSWALQNSQQHPHLPPVLTGLPRISRGYN